MEAVLTRLRGLSADELREEFARADLKCGPITATTRAIFERKLARVLAKSEDSCSTETDSSSTPNDSGSAASSSTNQNSAPCATSASALTVNNTSSTSPPQAASEDVDFGYGMGLNPPEEEEISVKSRTTSNFSAEGSCPDTPSKQVSQTFFGVCPVWEDVFARNERAHVYTDKKEALQVVKMMKGARFKAFSNREDAEKFAKGICDYYPSPHKSMSCVSPVKLGLVCKDNMEVDTINRERANSFKSPRTQDLTAKLRKAVEKGDEAAFSELVWSNPRYLIGSGDNPTIVQEGCRYNVMHVAAKENQAGIVQLLLDTLENPEFMRLMYPDDKDVMLQKRIHYIVDLYLNTPDKAGFETALHFACKFGCPEVVNILCSHPDIDKNCKNKYDQKPCDVICDRRNKTQEARQKICEYLEDRCYIPLLRATDNSAQPVIGAPWSPAQPVIGAPWSPAQPVIGANWSPDPLDRTRSYSPQSTRSPKDPVMAVKAFAGPLSPSKADEFRRAWKTPPRDRARHFHHILKSDPDRGAERVGRDLARELGHPWAEYWDFLQSFVDLSSAEGLRKLEDYLNNKDFSQRGHEEAGENETINRFRTPSPGKPKKFCNSISVGAFLDEGDDITLEEMKNRQNAALSRTITSSARSKDSGSLKGAMGGHEFHILPMAAGLHHHRADLIEAAAEQDPLCCCQDDDLLSPTAACKNGLCPSTSPPFSSSSRDRTRNGDKVSPRSSTSSSSASCLLSPISNLMVEFERMSLQDSLDGPPVIRERRSSGGSRHREARDASPSHYSSAGIELSSGLGRLSLAHTCQDSVFVTGSEEASEETGWRTEGGGSEGEDGDVSSIGSSEEYFDTEDSLDGLGGQRTRGAVSGRTLCARSKSWDHGGRDLSSSGSSGSSYKSLDNSEFLPRTPPRIRKGLFLDGESPTKLDRDVLVAIEAIDIDLQKHPCIHKWKSTIKKYSTSDMQSWPSPAVVKPPLHSHTPGSPAGSSLASPVSRFSPVRHAAASPQFSPSRYSPAHASFNQSCVNSYVSRYMSRDPFN